VSRWTAAAHGPPGTIAAHGVSETFDSQGLGPQAIMGRASAENFPVAMRLLAPSHRRRLLAIYGFARLVDQLGDAVSGDRVAWLRWLESELDRAYAGTAQHPLMGALTPILHECAMPREPFLRLIEANRSDQRRQRYETFDELHEYCRLSADPVGELVLYAFGRATPARIELSDMICTGLQLLEHWQDVAEDLANGRVYLPREDIERFGCSEDELAQPTASRPLRALMEFEVVRARELIERGASLVRTLHGRPRVAVAGFVGGGLAGLDAIAAADYDILGARPRPSRAQLSRAIVKALWP
jgi:squalene synthase HpnC